MDPLIVKVEKIVAEKLNGKAADMEVLPGGRIAGHVISPKFDGLDFEERRSLLRQALESSLDRDEVVRLSLVLTYSPQEWNVVLS